MNQNKSFPIDRHSFTLLISIVVFLLTLSPIGTQAEEKRDDDEVVKAHGQEYRFPLKVEFADQTWTRDRRRENTRIPGVSYIYKSDKPNTRLRYTQNFPPQQLKEQWYIQVREDEHSDWIMHGKSMGVFASGMRSELTFEKMVVEGPCRMFYANGKLRFTGEYKNGLKEGKGRGYHPDGTLWWEGNYHHAALSRTDLKRYDADEDELIPLDAHEANEVIDEWHIAASKDE